jgi:hypothetical protein
VLVRSDEHGAHPTKCEVSSVYRVKKFLFLTCFALLSLPLAASSPIRLLEAEILNPCPIHVGEVLTYRVKIAGISAGHQVTKVVEATTLNGQPVYRLTSESHTSSLFAKLYHFRDEQESYVTTDQLYPVQFTKDLEDRKYRAEVTVSFDLKTGTAQYSKNQHSKEIEVPVGTQNELSMVYFVRSKDLRVGQTYTFPVLVKDKAEKVTLKPYRREIMKTEGLGQVETVALRTSHGYLIWLTNDEHRIPVRIEAETRIGKLIGTLEKVDFIN